MMIKAESYKIFIEIYCPIVPAPLELYFGDGYRSVWRRFQFKQRTLAAGTSIRMKNEITYCEFVMYGYPTIWLMRCSVNETF